ncbi:flagellar accessory protein FlaH [Oxyplasma meridianum]|uniref:Flagellar accessory protein FlaH n=1 Tax=Oxyplasma meridianum TaxID=3073602 RepID=A0AAX4NET4_9ARCH
MFLNFTIEGDELDRRMGGGLYVGQIVTIIGGNGEGKTLLSLRLSYGVMKHGTEIAYISTQFPIREFVSEAEALGYSLFNPILSGQVSYITTVFLLRKSRRSTVDEMLNNEGIKEKQMVLIDSFKKDIFRDFNLSDFFSKLRKFSEGRVVILTVNPQDFTNEELTMIKQLSTTIINLTSKDLAGERKHIIDLMKYPMAMKSFQQAIPFRIEPGRGLIVEISSVS